MAAAAPHRPWWAELAAVVPRSVSFARSARQPGLPVPPLSPSPLALATVAVDEMAMSAAYLFSRRSAERISDEALSEAVEAVRRLRAAGVVADPVLAHPAPGAPQNLRLTRRSRLGVDFEHLSFTSTYTPPVAVPGLDRWGEQVGNTAAHAYLLRGTGRPNRPWLLVLHGTRMGEPRDLRLLGGLRLHRDLDVDVAHLVLPMHGPRGRTGGRAFPGVDAVCNFLGFAQAVSDARALLGWLRSNGAGPVGVYGVSLGGHVAALLAALETGIDCVVAGVPTSDVATMLGETMRGRWGEDAVAASHVLDDAPRTLSGLVSPLSFRALVPLDRRFIYGAVGDRLVTPQQALALWQHWEHPAILWLQGGHIANNVGAARRFVVDALTSSG